MGHVIITLKIMPENPEVDLTEVQKCVDKLVEEFAGKPSQKQELEPVAFGLTALKLVFIADEDKGGTENLEKDICNVPGVNSVDVIGLDRPLG